MTPIVLHLRPGSREWYFAWLRAQHPALVGRYLDMYGRSAYAPKAYQARISGQVRELADKYAVGRPKPGCGHGRRPPRVIPAPWRTDEPADGSPEPGPRAPAEQLTLL